MRTLILFGLAAVLYSCGIAPADRKTADVELLNPTDTSDAMHHPAWSYAATIYEMDTRKHTVEGTLQAAARDLPRLAALGVDIICLMPVHPIGVINKRGDENKGSYIVGPGLSSLGRPYSGTDYAAISPDFGDFEAFDYFVESAHSLGLRVILDWVASHTAIDAVWTREHLEYYLLDSAGGLQSPRGTDWWDVAELDWECGVENGLYDAMEEAMVFWVRDHGVEGFRCDLAMEVPTLFWDQARVALEQINPDVFMLAESEDPGHHRRAFDMSYGWHAHHLFNKVADRSYPIDSLRGYIEEEQERFGRGDFRMLFVTSHDVNAWNGSIEERMGPNEDAISVLAGTWFGMPMLYSGQAAGLSKHFPLYTALNALHHREPALHAGLAGAWPREIETAHPDAVYAFARRRGDSEVLVALNLGNDPRTVAFDGVDFEQFEHVLGSLDPHFLTAHGYAVWRRK